MVRQLAQLVERAKQFVNGLFSRLAFGLRVIEEVFKIAPTHRPTGVGQRIIRWTYVNGLYYF